MGPIIITLTAFALYGNMQCKGMPLQQFLSSEMLWGFSALIKLVYTSDDPAQYWMRTIHLREIYHSLECDTKAISVGEIG